MMFVRQCVAAAALALAGCAVELDLDQGPILEDLFGGDPFEASDEALAALPDRFVIMASEESDADAGSICGWLIARLQRSCDVVRSEGDRLDFQRAAATPGMLIIGSAEASADFPRFRSVRWRDVNGYLFLTREFGGIETDAALRGSRVAAGDSTQSVAESLIAAADLDESDFRALIGLGDLRARPRQLTLARNLCAGDFDMLVAPTEWLVDFSLERFEEWQEAEDRCALVLVSIRDATITAMLDARSDLDRRPFPETPIGFAFERSCDDYTVIVHARNVLYADLMPPLAEDALRRALTLPLQDKWEDELRERFRVEGGERRARERSQ